MEGTTTAKKATIGFILSLIGGIFILLGGIAMLVLSQMLKDLGIGDIMGIGLAFDAMGGIGVLCAIVVFIGAWLIYTPGREMIGGILVLVFSIVSIVSFGGFALGMILGIVGGILGLLKK